MGEGTQIRVRKKESILKKRKKSRQRRKVERLEQDRKRVKKVNSLIIENQRKLRRQNLSKIKKRIQGKETSQEKERRRPQEEEIKRTGRIKKKILKRLNKMKKNKGKRRKVTDSRQDSCQTLECLNDLVQTLKVEKDTVRNFLAQEKRVASKISLMVNKQSKK